MLLASFNTKLQDRQIWFSAFDEMYSSKKDTFENLETYNDWISSLTYSVKFELPMLDENLTEIRKQDKREYFAIKYEGFEIDEFEDVIRKVSSVANNFVKSNLIVNFEKQIIVKEQGDRFTKEDLHNSISNLMVDYDKKISVRLAFLEEQSKIARKIGVAKNTFESQTYQNTSASVTNVQTDAPFYMRGFEAIEEEIFLLKSRKNKENHIAELIDLEAQVRAIEQDLTVVRAKTLFEGTPLKNSSDIFAAAAVDINEAEVNYIRKGSFILALSLVLGGFIGVVAVFIRKALLSK
jgi:LPS O-antigen subunit length determinant protein (WzzB/FepE family)